MITIRDTLAGEPIASHYANTREDWRAVLAWARKRHGRILAMDTESTGINCYKPGWELRTFQFGNGRQSFIVPARAKNLIRLIFTECDIKWIGHNAPHDVRCIDTHLGYETGIVCPWETYIPAHHADSRKQDEGGTGHGLKELATAHVDPDAGKWERRLKARFKTIKIPMEGEVYKSGPRKGTQKFRRAKLSEGWGLIDPTDPIYLAYAGADPILTYHLRTYYRLVYRQFRSLYDFDHRVALACDRLQRRAIKLDVDYTQRYQAALEAKAARLCGVILNEFNCRNIYSAAQIADTLQSLGAQLRERTPSGQYKTDDRVMQWQLENGSSEVQWFVRAVLAAKRLTKRADAYADAMLRERDAQDRVHPSINSLAARTARMSISGPALQQLPTKDNEEE
jgi:DNA polymerase I